LCDARLFTYLQTVVVR